MPEPGILTAAELASVRREYRGATLLPKRTYHDAAIFDWERREILRRDWVLVAREEEVARSGYLRAGRGRRREPHRRPQPRGPIARLLQRVPPSGHGRGRGAVRQDRPLPVPVPRLDLRPRWRARPGQAHRRPRRLRLRHVRPGIGPPRRPGRASSSSTWRPRARRWPTSSATSSSTSSGSTSDVSGRPGGSSTRSTPNWKFIAENYSECYHCPGVHPQLNKLTPYDLGGDFEPHGAWQGGWMELVGEAETMALDGGHGSTRRPTADARDHARSTSAGSSTTSCGR